MIDYVTIYGVVPNLMDNIVLEFYESMNETVLKIGWMTDKDKCCLLSLQIGDEKWNDRVESKRLSGVAHF